EDATEHDGLAVVHQYLRDDFLSVDGGDVHATGLDDILTDAVLVDVEIEDDAVVRCDLRRHLQGQHRLLERNRGRAARGRLLVGDLDTLLDGGLFLVGRNDTRRGDDRGTGLGL